MAGGRNQDPLMSYRFAIEINSLVKGFAEASGLFVEVQTEDVREGGLNVYPHKLIKGAAYQNLTLKRGITTDEELWRWHQDIVNGGISRKSISIILLDNKGEEVCRWHFREAFPVKWTGPDLKAESSAVGFETLEFAHHGLYKM